MEPSTNGENIRQKGQRKSLYDQRQVLDLILEGGIDERALWKVISTPFKALLRLQIFSSDLYNSQSPKKTLSRKG